jgi:SAM-dependent methyltransferase
VRRFLESTLALLRFFGIDPLTAARNLRALPWFLRDWSRLRAQQRAAPDGFPIERIYPCLLDRDGEAGSASGHYFHQDLLVARRIFSRTPERHIDIGSRIDGFVAHVASFREIEVIDIRPNPQPLPNVRFRQLDFGLPLPSEMRSCADSVSCLHALEHFGLGRYGDQVRHDGFVPAAANLVDMLRPGGMLYVSVPIGPQRVEFNAHRVFSVAQLLRLFEPPLRLDGFSYVDDSGALKESVELTPAAIAANLDCKYGCGIFEFLKISEATPASQTGTATISSAEPISSIR